MRRAELRPALAQRGYGVAEMTHLSDPIYVPVWVALSTMVPATISAVSSALNTRHLAKLAEAQKAMRTQVDTIKAQTDGMTTKLMAAKDELRASTNEEARAQGQIEGRVQAQTEQK